MPPETAAIPLVGRVGELGQLIELVGLSDPAGRAVLLGGEAGAGKSRLIRELSVASAAAGWRVLIGHCVDFGDGSPPYLPFSDALGRLASESPGTAEVMIANTPAIARLFPAHRMRSGGDDDREPTGRAVLFEAVQSAFIGLSETAPLLVILEDVHWADQSSRDLLRWLFTREFNSPISIVATYRSDDLHRRHPLRAALAEWVRLPSVTRLQLGPLSNSEAQELIRALHPEALDVHDLAHILARAEGNPFFIEELVAATEVSDGLLPVDLADLLLVRLEQLDLDARLVVRAAAVAGRRVSHPLLACGTDLSGTSLDAAIRAAVDANILVGFGDDGYAFRHALLAEAVYQDLLPGERVRLHAAYVDALVSRRAEGSAAELARHARASHDLAIALRASVEAGDEALAVGGPEEALRHYELALELLSDPRVASDVRPDVGSDNVSQVGLVIRASRAAADAGHLQRSVALAEAELQALPPDADVHDRVELIQAVATTALVMDIKLDVLRLTTEAIQLLSDEAPSPLQARMQILHARASADRARDDDAARWASEALRTAREFKLASVAADATILLARLDERSGEPERARTAIETAVDEAIAAGAPFAELRATCHLATLHYSQGRVVDAMAVFDRAADLARTLGRQWGPYGLDSVVFGAIAALTHGDWERAAKLVDVRGQTPPALAEAILAAIGLEIAAGRGEIAALSALPAVRSRWELDGLIAITSGGAAIELYGLLGDVAASERVHDEAIDTVVALWQRPGFLARVRLTALAVGQLATAAATATGVERLAYAERGDRLAREALEIAAAARNVGPESVAWTARVEAEHARLRWLAGLDAGAERGLVDRWRRAVKTFEDFGHVYEIARSQARLAAVLVAVGEADEANGLCTVARQTAARLGAKPLLVEIRSLTGSASPVPRPPDHDSETLTPREHDVLVLVATGRSNKEIAQQLFISPKTVSVHISNIMAKFDAASRTEAVAVARRRELLS